MYRGFRVQVSNRVETLIHTAHDDGAVLQNAQVLVLPLAVGERPTRVPFLVQGRGGIGSIVKLLGSGHDICPLAPEGLDRVYPPEVLQGDDALHDYLCAEPARVAKANEVLYVCANRLKGEASSHLFVTERFTVVYRTDEDGEAGIQKPLCRWFNQEGGVCVELDEFRPVCRVLHHLDNPRVEQRLPIGYRENPLRGRAAVDDPCVKLKVHVRLRLGIPPRAEYAVCVAPAGNVWNQESRLHHSISLPLQTLPSARRSRREHSPSTKASFPGAEPSTHPTSGSWRTPSR